MTMFPRMEAGGSWPAPMSELERTGQAEAAFADAQRREETDPETLTDHLLFVAWRITREAARVRGLIQANKECLATVPKIWNISDFDRGIPAPPEADNPIDHVKYLAYRDEVSLAFRPSAPIRPWTYLVEFIAGYLNIAHTGPVRAALNLLVDNPAVYWPTPAELGALDLRFIEGVSRRILRQSRPEVSRSLQKRYGLLAHEANNLTLAATHLYTYLSTGDLEAEKGLMIARLEGFAHRMREAMHPREEIHALKTIATIQGLTKPERQEADEDMTDVLERVAGEKTTPPQLPGPKIPEDVAPPE